ncbi:hypothetical protein GIB67_011446 [Kingdonia uniflora]|uniref:Uncharacterized protein n=1 Tax=Kingdonia uniflora TaxID=39325 RepID=A0A7J7NLD6_9MAGN|nr:hypothetical protein GIB67_011446 [Kingdonia uniflora]
MEIENPQLDNETTNYQDTERRGLRHQHSIGDQSENLSNIFPDCVNSRGYDADAMSLRTSIPLSHRRKPSDATTLHPHQHELGGCMLVISSTTSMETNFVRCLNLLVMSNWCSCLFIYKLGCVKVLDLSNLCGFKIQELLKF